jgi:hypothetical protein
LISQVAARTRGLQNPCTSLSWLVVADLVKSGTELPHSI